jgi:hypothetical protein
LHRLTRHRRTRTKRFGLAGIDEPNVSIELKRGRMTRRDAEAQRTQSEIASPLDHGIEEKPTDASSAVLRRDPDLKKVTDGWIVLVASAPGETNRELVDDRHQRHLLACGRSRGEAILPLGVRALYLSLIRAAEGVR